MCEPQPPAYHHILPLPPAAFGVDGSAARAAALEGYAGAGDGAAGSSEGGGGEAAAEAAEDGCALSAYTLRPLSTDEDEDNEGEEQGEQEGQGGHAAAQEGEEEEEAAGEGVARARSSGAHTASMRSVTSGSARSSGGGSSHGLQQRFDLISPPQAHLASPAFIRRVLRLLGLAAIKTTRVQHCYKAYGIRLEAAPAAAAASQVPDAASASSVSHAAPTTLAHVGSSSAGNVPRSSSSSGSGGGRGSSGGAALGPGEGWSVVYSGDTRPCQELVHLGQGGPLLRPVYPEAYAALCATRYGSSAAAGSGAAAAGPEAAEAPAAAPLAVQRSWKSAAGAVDDGSDAPWSGAAPQLPRDASSVSHASYASSHGGHDGCADSHARGHGRGCSLLIHEATFEDSAEGRANAIDKKHSTAGEGIAVANGMRSRHTLLTHFSARYPKVPVLKLEEEEDEDSDDGAMAIESGTMSASGERHTCGRVPPPAPGAAGTVAQLMGGPASSGGASGQRTLFVAYDLMTVHGSTLRALPALLPGLHVLFAEEDDEEASTGAADVEEESAAAGRGGAAAGAGSQAGAGGGKGAVSGAAGSGKKGQTDKPANAGKGKPAEGGGGGKGKKGANAPPTAVSAVNVGSSAS
jgi:ribonuclease BN (tRNA processing enzyme)